MIGADGVGSAVRAQLLGVEGTSFSGQEGFRGVSQGPHPDIADRVTKW